MIEYIHAAGWRSVRLGLLAACALSACSQSQEVELPAGASTIIALEERLMNAEAIRVVFHLSAEGVIQADIRGELLLADHQEIHLAGAGVFGGQQVEFLAQTEEGLLHFGPTDNQFSMREPSDLKTAMLVGFVRMGILHNVARVTAGAPPDQTEGGVRDWVTLRNVVQDSDAATTMFEITVAGEPAGSASLTLNEEGYPLIRRQSVHFPGGEMRVTERYSEVLIIP